jgi:hypothetical protein
MKLEFSLHLLEKYSNIKFNYNPSSGSRVVDGGTDTTKLIVAFRNFANGAKTGCVPVVRNTVVVLLLLRINWLHGNSFQFKQFTAFVAALQTAATAPFPQQF